MAQQLGVVRLVFGSRLSNSYFCIVLHLSFVSRGYCGWSFITTWQNFDHLRLVRDTTECTCGGISIGGWQSGEDLPWMTVTSHRSLPPKGKSRKHIEHYHFSLTNTCPWSYDQLSSAILPCCHNDLLPFDHRLNLMKAWVTIHLSPCGCDRHCFTKWEQ